MVAGALASLALVSGWQRRLPLWLPVVFLTTLHLTFHALPRYRLPLDPLLIVVASGSLAAWQRRIGGLVNKQIVVPAGQGRHQSPQ
jgi:hypothetical protein